MNAYSTSKTVTDAWYTLVNKRDKDICPWMAQFPREGRQKLNERCNKEVDRIICDKLIDDMAGRKNRTR